MICRLSTSTDAIINIPYNSCSCPRQRHYRGTLPLIGAVVVGSVAVEVGSVVGGAGSVGVGLWVLWLEFREEVYVFHQSITINPRDG